MPSSQHITRDSSGLDSTGHEKQSASQGQPSDGSSPSSDGTATDYDERAASFWAVYVQEAESHDKALINSWRDDMAVVITFAGLFSATVTTFLVASYPMLQPDPPTQTETLAEQTVFLLTQIAVQLGTNSSTLPSTLPAQLEAFTPTASDVRVNTYWSVSLVFSLTAALFATIVQQWARDYMHFYQRYSNNLKRARIRQYLFEGADEHKMSFMVELIPTLIHASLFLFFAGLCDMLWQINQTVAALTSMSIAISVVIYSWTIIAPAINAQSPYQSPLSRIFWWIFQTLNKRTYRDKSSGGISNSMTDGRVQLAMSESHDRVHRDARAICWVIDHLTEDVELEPFLAGIPGSLGTGWGKSVWAEVAKITNQQNIAGPWSSTDTVMDLNGRITRLLRTCLDPGILNPRSRRRRARVCVDAALSLVLDIEGQRQWFADKEIMAMTLHYLADPANHPRDRDQDVLPTADPLFRNRWLCMAIMTVHALLQDDRVRNSARQAVRTMAAVSGQDAALSGEAAALKSAAMFDKQVKKAWHAARVLREKLDPDAAQDQLLTEILNEHNEHIAELEYCWNVFGWAKPSEDSLLCVIRSILDVTEGILTLLPGASIQLPEDPTLAADAYGVNGALIPHFLPPSITVSRLAQTAWRLRKIQTIGWERYSPKPSNLRELCPDELFVDDMRRHMSAEAVGQDSPVQPFREQLWRLQDLGHDYGGTLYVVDLLFSAMRSVSAKQALASKELFMGTFSAVTVNWRMCCNSMAFQMGIVALLRNALWKSTVGSSPPPSRLPLYIVEKMIKLVKKVLTAAEQPHVDNAVKLVTDFASIAELPPTTQALARKFLVGLEPPRAAAEIGGK